MLLVREISLAQIRDDCMVNLMLYMDWFQYDAPTTIYIRICDLCDFTVL